MMNWFLWVCRFHLRWEAILCLLNSIMVCVHVTEASLRLSFNVSWKHYNMHFLDQLGWIVLQVLYLFCSKFQLPKYPETYPWTRDYQVHASAPIIGWQCLSLVGTITYPPDQMFWWWNCRNWDTEKLRGDIGRRRKEKWKVCKLPSQTTNKSSKAWKCKVSRRNLKTQN